MLRKLKPTHRDSGPTDLDLASVEPRIGELRRQRAALAERRREVIGELDPIIERLRVTAERTPDEPRFGDRIRPGTRAALAAVGGTSLALPAVAGDDAEYSRLRAALADIDAAIELLDDELRRLRFPASAVIVERVRPEHERRARAVALSLVEAARAYREYLQLASELDRHDVAWSALGAAYYRPFGDPDHADAPIRAVFRHMLSLGRLSAGDLPAEWRA